MTPAAQSSALDSFHACTRDWFLQAFDGPTRVQTEAWPAIANRESTLLLAPTGSGKTLAAFLAAIDRLFFEDVMYDGIPGPLKHGSDNASTALEGHRTEGIRVVYVSPLKALGVDVDRNLRAPIAGLRAFAERHDVLHRVPSIAVRSGDTPQRDRVLFVKHPPDILITTPESLYLMLTSKAASVLTSVETVIVDEIHAMAGTKRGAHLFVTLERLERLRSRASGEQRDVSLLSAGGIAAHESADLRLAARQSQLALQRIGLSATQRPLEEIARLLGGGTASADPNASPIPRPISIIDASERRRFELTVETPAEEREKYDRAERRLTSGGSPEIQAEENDDDIPIGRAASSPSILSVWPSIHPRLVELIRQNRSTMIFVNSRRLAERLAGAINELAEEEIALAHHGSVSKDARTLIEDRLKRGDLPAIVATSSMELGIDMGAVDLVIQIEAPPSIASGTQRIGRAGHQVGAVSIGVIFPKYKGDLLACSAATGAMLEGWVEETHYPRNPLDILAQQIVAVVARETIAVDDLYALMRGAAPFFDLARSSFDSVLDLLSGRYPSDEFSELRPRINWDRISGLVSGRRGSQRLAILNGGTIPDRGLYGVFLVGNDGESGSRVGELDEEMVFECRPGDVFRLGASSWRVMDITRDRVLVVPAPGEPGRMPFWRGDGPGRPREFGAAIGRLTRELAASKRPEAIKRLTEDHGLQSSAANSLLDYLHEQLEATGELPTDQSIVIESFMDEVGDWRMVILSPFGSRVHAPWAMLVAAKLRTETDGEVDVLWTDDGIVFRVPESVAWEKGSGVFFRNGREGAAQKRLPTPFPFFFPEPDEVEEELIRQLGGTALFAAKFRENAARSLLLPRRSPTRRTPLWLQRRKSGDLLKVASRFRSFPMLMETYRECLRDVFDIGGLVSLLKDVKTRAVRVRSIRSDFPSPFASAVLFNFVGNFVYEGDAPLAERKAATLALDHAQLRELLGTVDFRELFDAAIVEELLLELQRIPRDSVRRDSDPVETGEATSLRPRWGEGGQRPDEGAGRGETPHPGPLPFEGRGDDYFVLRDADDLHDLLLNLGPLSRDEIQLRTGDAVWEGEAPAEPFGDWTRLVAAAGQVPRPPNADPTASEGHRTASATGSESRHTAQWLAELISSRRIFATQIASDQRFAAAEDAARLRDALGIVPPVRLADAFLAPVEEALVDLVSRYARTHTPFTAEDVAARFGLGTGPILTTLAKLAACERVVEGEFLPHELRKKGSGVFSRNGPKGASQKRLPTPLSTREWCDVNVLRTLKRRTLAALRKEVEPVEPKSLARFLPEWHGITRPRRGLDGLLDAIEQLQGAPLPASTLENEILPARVTGFRSADLDELCLAGEVIWQGCDSTASNDGRIVLYLTDRFPLLSPPVEPLVDDMAERLRSLLRERGALFFDQICGELHGFPNDMLDLVWRMVWNGEVTNDTLTPLRSLRAGHKTASRSERRTQRMFRSRRQSHLPGSEGRWTMLGVEKGVGSLLPDRPEGCFAQKTPDPFFHTITERQTAIAAQLIERHGIVTKEVLAREEIVGGFAGLYPVLKAMEETGKVRRGYFVAGLGAAQFAAPGAEDRLREQRAAASYDGPPRPSNLASGTGSVASEGHRTATTGSESRITEGEPLVLAATDPANPWGSVLRWPETDESSRPQRVAGAKVIIHEGELLAYLGRTRQTVRTFSLADAPDTKTRTSQLAAVLAKLAVPGRSMLLTKVDGVPTAESFLAAALLETGFASTTKGFLHKGRAQV